MQFLASPLTLSCFTSKTTSRDLLYWIILETRRLGNGTRSKSGLGGREGGEGGCGGLLGLCFVWFSYLCIQWLPSSSWPLWFFPSWFKFSKLFQFYLLIFGLFDFGYVTRGLHIIVFRWTSCRLGRKWRKEYSGFNFLDFFTHYNVSYL